MSTNSNLNLTTTALGSTLMSLLSCDEIVPGSDPSYQICKTLFLYHPLGQKMTEAPIKMAQFLPREFTCKRGPEEELVKALRDQEKKDDVQGTVKALGTLARIYGIASLALVEKDGDTTKPLDLKNIAGKEIAYSTFDPLNTAGSLVTNQNPNDILFQKYRDIVVQGVVYHRSRSVTLMHEQPIYIAYTSSSFGFVGRSVYQRALFPLKSFINTMFANDMVARKAGLLVIMMKAAGSIVDNVMNFANAFKRNVLKIGETNNVINIDIGEDIKSVDLTNIDGPLSMARKHILEDTAVAGDMPAVILNSETFAEGFGEGTEDAKKVAAFVEGIREWLAPAYDFIDAVTRRRAWNEDFFNAIKDQFPEDYKNKTYDQAFFEWENGFEARWPSLLQEPESEKVRVADTKLKAIIAAAQVFLPEMDPENKVMIFKFIEEQINSTPILFTTSLTLDFDTYLDWCEKNAEKAAAMQEDKAPDAAPPFSARDSAASVLSSYMNSPGDGDIRERIANVESIVRRKGLG